MKLIVLAFTITSAFSLLIFSQDKLGKGIVANVGNNVITGEEFSERYEFTPQFRKQVKQMQNSLKLEFLYSLIAEKLWADESVLEGLDQTDVIKFAGEQIEKMYVRDELYSREIKNKVQISDLELIRGTARSNIKLKVNFLFSEDKEEIFNLYNLLNEGVPFDTILTESPEMDEQKTPMDIVFGQMEESTEDSLYSLKINGYTSPILTPDGWYIFRLVNRYESLMENQKDIADGSNDVKKTLEARKINVLVNDYYRNFFKGLKVDADVSLFKSLYNKLTEVFQYKLKNYHLKNNQLLSFEPADVIRVEKEFGSDTLKKIFIRFDKDPMTLSTFIRILAFDVFQIKQDELSKLRAAMNKKVRETIERELLSREGYRQKLNFVSSVQHEVKMWRENYLSQVLQNKFLDSATVTQEEVFTEYQKLQKQTDYPREVNIIEILTDSIETCQKIMREIESGADMHKVAMKYTKREWTKKNNGEFGYFPVTTFGDIGKIASKLKVGELYGPLKLSEGYSIFKVIGFRDSMSVPPAPFEKLKGQLERDISFRKLKSKMTNYTVSLAEKFGVGIDMDYLQSIEVTDVNMFGIRFMGFGGKTVAVPIIAPNTDWVDIWLNKRNLIQ
jgi:parvulin-like peptidyl-prolyl isomerase